MISSEMMLDSQVDLYDSEIAAIAAGPLRYAQERAGSHMDVDQFTRDLTEQFAHLGLKVDVQVWTTKQDGLYKFIIEIQRRMLKPFDHDQMVWEVTHNVLDIPGAPTGFIDTNEGMKDFLRKQHERKRGHNHG